MTRTLADRVTAMSVPCGDCLIWKGATNNAIPAIRIGGCTCSVRVALWREMGRRLLKGQSIRAKCGEPLCVAPTCLEPLRFREFQRSPMVRAQTAKINKARAKINETLAEEIRASEEPSRLLAERYQVSERTIQRVRSYEVCRPVYAPFAGLGAR